MRLELDQREVSFLQKVPNLSGGAVHLRREILDLPLQTCANHVDVPDAPGSRRDNPKPAMERP